MYFAAVWLQRVQERMGRELEIDWRYFSLEQVNSTEGPGWKMWEQPAEYESRGRLAFHAAEAARQQGKDRFERFNIALLRARHEEGKKIFLRETVDEVARAVGLDMARFESDLANPGLLRKIGEDHTVAVEQHGVFGTPTLIFENGRAAYIKMKPAAPEEETMPVWADLYRTIAQRPFIEEVKRPVPPPGTKG